MAKTQTPRFSHLRAGDLATLHSATGDVPVRVVSIKDGSTLTVSPTADRPGFTKGFRYPIVHNLAEQHVTTRTKSETTLLVF